MNIARRTLNVGCGKFDNWGTDKLDRESFGKRGITVFDLNSRKPLPFKDKTFDEIRCLSVIQVLFYPQEFIGECHRILKSGGKFKIDTLNAESIFFYFFPIRDNPVRFGKANYNNGLTTGTYNVKALSNRLKHAGFEILEVKKMSNRFPFKDHFYILCKKD